MTKIVTGETLTQALNEIKDELSEKFNIDKVNLAELERITGISRVKLRRLKANKFVAMKSIEKLEKKIQLNSGRKIYPNESCPCGSGKKYKKCCGRIQINFH